MIRSIPFARALAATAALALAVPAAAEEWAQLGSRYQAMGGAAVAVADDAQAAYWNPGALAFTPEGWDASLPAGVTVGAEGDVVTRIDEVADVVDAAEATLDAIDQAIQNGTGLTEAQAQAALALLLEDFPSLDQDGEGLIGTTQGGLGVRYGRIAISGLGLGYLAADPVVDGVNVGFADNAGQIFAVAPAGRDFAALGTPELQPIADDLATDPNLSQEQAEELVFLASQAVPGFASNPQAQQILANVAAASTTAGGDFDGNQSGAIVRGLQTVQVGVAYGHPVPELPFLPWLKDRVGVGANLKYIRGIAYNKTVVIEEADDIFDDLRSFDNTKKSNDWGLDLGLKVRVFDWLHAGMVARNVNTPTFDALPNTVSSDDEFSLDPQVRMGVAAYPFERWVVSADLDLTRNESELIDGFESQMFALGTEYKLPLWKLGLAFRGGLYTNVASGEAAAPVMTGGLGLRFWYFNFDLAGSVATKWEEVEDVGSLPSRASVSAMLGFSKEF